MAIRNSVSGAAALLIGVGGVVGSLSGCSVSPPSAAAETDEVYVRMLHASPGSSTLGVLAGEGAEGIGSTLYFGMLTSYERMAAGQYDLGISLQTPGLGNDSFSDIDLVATAYADLSQQEYYTIMAVGMPSRVSVVVLNDDQIPAFDRASVRFVHVVPDIPMVQWTDALEEIYVPLLEYGQASDYVEFDPGFNTLELREISFPESEVPETDELATGELQLGRLLESYDLEFRAGKVYTVYLTGLLRGEPELEVLVAEQATED